MSKSLIKPTENEVSEKPKTHCENPYKTCAKLMNFEPKSQKGFQNDQKSITFIDKTHMAFRQVENLIKPVENDEFRVPKRQKVRNREFLN